MAELCRSVGDAPSHQVAVPATCASEVLAAIRLLSIIDGKHFNKMTLRVVETT